MYNRYIRNDNGVYERMPMPGGSAAGGGPLRLSPPRRDPPPGPGLPLPRPGVREATGGAR